MQRLTRLSFDGFTAALAGTVLLASLLPARGAAAPAVGVAANLGIALLFFLHGARLSPRAALAGATHWRLHAVVFGATFLFFPLLGLAVHPLLARLLPPAAALGVLFLCALPSTVQSSIAFTSIAGGNVPAAVFSASTSSLLGIVLTPILVSLLAQLHGTAFSLGSLQAVLLQLALPFLAGQLLHRWIGGWTERNRRLLHLADRGSILLIVYSAFSEAVVNGLWGRLSPEGLALLVVVDGLLLAAVLAATVFASRRLGFSRADEITIMFCGSKKSLASGIPIASLLFPAHAVGMIVLPVMLFHQIQLFVCALLARRYAQAGRLAARLGGDLRPTPSGEV